MGITTKTGDSGKTSLLFGKKIPKDDLRVEACGTLDELCSFLGMAKSLITERGLKSVIESIQKDLFVIGTEVAAAPKHLNKLKKRITKNSVSKMDELIGSWEVKNRSRATCFCLPGENLVSSSFDISRTIARRAERTLVTLKRKKIVSNGDIIVYLNRLSDLLYLFARSYGQKTKTK
jgi:ATP:cob(I)alamin adenosyltransferase